MWKAFKELQALGWLERDRTPRMISVQSDGCAPIVRAFEAGDRFATPWENAWTCASGLRVPSAVGDFMILDSVRESGGCAIAVPESQIVPAMHRAVSAEGIAFCPEAAACALAVDRLSSDGRIRPTDHVVLFNTGATTKYVETVSPNLPTIDNPHDVDYSQFAR
jgi:threonine synthase